MTVNIRLTNDHQKIIDIKFDPDEAINSSGAWRVDAIVALFLFLIYIKYLLLI